VSRRPIETAYSACHVIFILGINDEIILLLIHTCLNVGVAAADRSVSLPALTKIFEVNPNNAPGIPHWKKPQKH